MGEITVTVHLDMDINGQPVEHIYSEPATMEPLDKHQGLTVHLHLDAAKLAKAIYPELAKLMHRDVVMRRDIRQF